MTPDQIKYAQQIPNSFSYDRALIWILNSEQVITNCHRKHDSTFEFLKKSPSNMINIGAKRA